jgi:hypothetical protein
MRPDQLPPTGNLNPARIKLVGAADSCCSDSAVPRDTLQPDRLAVILGRLSDRFYDRVEVRNRIAAGVANELE